MATNTELYIDKLRNNPQNKIMISSPNCQQISAFVDADIDFGSTASYNANSIDEEALSAAKAGLDPVMRNTEYRMASKNLSKLVWQNSATNNLGFELFFIATKPGDNPLTDAVKIYDYLLPTGAGLLMVTPGRYETGTVLSSEVSNACNIKIGDWFFSRNQWVMISGSFSVSKQKQSGGVKPLYVKVSVQFQPVRDFYADEVKGWFKGA